MAELDKEMQKYSIRVSTNLRLLMSKDRVIKGTELAEKSGVSASTISQIRTDYQGKKNPDYRTLVKLAYGLDVDLIDLIKEA